MKISNGGGRREVKEFSFLCCLAMKILHHFCLPLETLFFHDQAGKLPIHKLPCEAVKVALSTELAPLFVAIC